MPITNELKKELEVRIKTILDFQTEKESLIREQKEFSFTPIKEKLFWFFDRIDMLQVHVDHIANEWPDTMVKDYCTRLDQIISLLTKIKTYDPTKIATPGPEKDGIITQVEQLYTEYYRLFQSDLLPAEKRVTTSEDTVKKILKEVGSKQKEIEVIHDKAQTTLKAIQSVAASSPVEKFSGIFNEQSIINNKSAKLWMTLYIATIIITIGIAWWLFNNFYVEIKNVTNTSGAIQLLVAKLVFISIAFYLLHRFSKNYSAQKHLESVNKHRESSLKVFKAFVESTNDDKIKNVILVQASKAIFDNVDTGYITQGSDVNSPEIKFIEGVLQKRD
ncbi:MAG: hypothetical protein COY66_03080 [Candidatus Kerfeldbacteria bacterium CG_4_10_14_0_8_um_filter_42_10]|uniref:Uncharacterized protein n=1 Tax=Candidatus Kerfeldbacteria bacterium CG_4_10_14_0_8_um_filter_42_10 TaxID=2014248 RepID=A0A2M7RK38_9BACT|nr:MAG: hypothetical protein COY66_03080 [Candidatus Kerfeldbacteria bacterium CG_4_10_14_0_8_um_filter_42_10]